jgi:hypothetical protein
MARQSTDSDVVPVDEVNSVLSNLGCIFGCIRSQFGHVFRNWIIETSVSSLDEIDIHGDQL